MEINLKSLKIALIVIIFLSGILGVLSPHFFKPYGNRLSYAALLSSGVLLAAALVHLLGDASDGLEDSPLPDFPWAFFFCGSAFYFLYFFEKFIVHKLAHSDHNHGNAKEQLIPNNNNRAGEINPPDVNDDDLILDDDGHGQELYALLKKRNYLTGIVLLAGLGLHSFLAGLALGGSTQESQAVALGIAIISHKYLAAFALGLPLYKSRIKLEINIFYALLFSILTPLGIGIGWILENTFDSWVGDIFVSIAAGTFVEVSVIEVLVPEFGHSAKRKERIAYELEEVRKELSRTANMGIEEQSQRLKARRIEIEREQREKNHTTEDFHKAIFVTVGFVLMSMLAFWV